MNAPTPVAALPRRRRVLESAIANLGATRGPHLSTRSGQFRLVGVNGQETVLQTTYIDIIVVDANDTSSRVYFGGREFDPNSNEPPVCFSDNGTGPSTQSMQPQSPTCAVCPNNVRGSDVTFTGKPTTACANRKKLAFILPDDATTTVYEMQIPPASLTNLKAYGQWLSEQGVSTVHGDALDMADVVTRVSWAPDKQFVLAFSAVSLADDENTLALIDHIHSNGLSDTAVGRLDVAHAPERVAQMLARPQGQAAAALAAPAGAALNGQLLPPRPQLVQQAAQEQPAEQATQQEQPKQPRAPRAPRPTAAPTGPAPFTPPVQAAAPIAPSTDGGIPAFLHRPTNGVPATPPAPKFGVGPAPGVPASLAEGLSKAMSLPTRK
jgi:hypothetical protein